jgi:hypothetical protein
MEVLMRTYILAIILAIAIAALFAIPTTAFSGSINVGHGGVRIGPSYGHHRLYNRYEGLYDRYEKANGAENCDQPACTKKN